MERRAFLTVAGAIAAPYQTRNAMLGHLFRVPTSAFPVIPAQEPTLAPEVFASRVERAQAELNSRKLDCLIATPSTNYEYFTGYNPGRSERLIAVVLPAIGKPVVVCPAFEVERIKQHSALTDARGWEEQENPYKLVRSVVRELKPHGNGVIALEPTTSYGVYVALADQLSGWKFVDGAPVTERLRIVKAPEELALIRRAIEITEAAIAATFAQLAAQVTERDVAQLLSREMQQRGAPGGGLAIRALERAAARWPGGAEAGARDGGADRRGLPRRGVRLRHHPHHLVRRQPVGRIPEGLQSRPRRPDRGHAARSATVYAVPGDGPCRPHGDPRRRLRPLLHAPPQPWPRHGRPRAALPR